MARRVTDATRILDRVTGKDRRLRKMIAEETLNARVAAMIHAARARAGLTQAQLAERIGVSKMAVSTWETGRKPIPKSRQAELGQVLGRWFDFARKPSRRSRGR